MYFGLPIMTLSGSRGCDLTPEQMFQFFSNKNEGGFSHRNGG
jgi:hypothetical protein